MTTIKGKQKIATDISVNDLDEESKIEGLEHYDDGQYPYLVIRWMSGVYGRKKIVFVDDGESALRKDALVVVAKGPCVTCGQLPVDQMPLIVAALRPIVMEQNRRMCLVLSANSCVFIEPDGKVEWSNSPPSGGLVIPDPEIVHGDEN